MAGIGMLMFAGGIVLVIQIALVAIFLISSGISIGVIGIVERKRQAKFGRKNPVHIFLSCYGFLVAASIIGTAIFLFFLDETVKKNIAENSLIYMNQFMQGIASFFASNQLLIIIYVCRNQIIGLIIGLSSLLIGNAEKKRQAKFGVKNPLHTLMMIFGGIVLAVTVFSILKEALNFALIFFNWLIK